MTASRLIALLFDGLLIGGLAAALFRPLYRRWRSDSTWLARRLQPFARVLCRLAALPRPSESLPASAETTIGQSALSGYVFLGAGVGLAKGIKHTGSLYILLPLSLLLTLFLATQGLVQTSAAAIAKALFTT